MSRFCFRHSFNISLFKNVLTKYAKINLVRYYEKNRKINTIQKPKQSSIYNLLTKIKLDSFLTLPQMCANFLDRNIGRCGCNVGHRNNASHFCLSCVRLVCFLRKSTECHDIRTECQRIIIHFLLLIYHKSAA